MAATSPALSNNSTDNPSSAGAFNFNLPPAVNMSKSLRGLNKPKCIKCGNVARSRCPFQSCKNCCSKAQNPCEIHVLKGSSSAPDKTASSSNSAKVEQQPTDVSHPGNPHRVVSLRQLSNTFAQFNNLSTPLRSKKPLTRKDAQLINEWRFLKLKEFRDRNIEVENEAFDRYVRNVSMLEEVFCVNSALDGQSEEGSSAVNGDSSIDDSNETMVAGLKLKLKSQPARIQNFRKRLQYIVDQGLKEVNRSELFDNNGAVTITDPSETVRRPKRLKSWRAERASTLADLLDKLNKAQNLEDLKACLPLKSQLKRDQADSDTDGKSSQNGESDDFDKPWKGYTPPKWLRARPVDGETLSKINEQFSSLEDIEDL